MIKNIGPIGIWFGIPILEDVLLDPMFELPGMESVQEIVVNDDVIAGEAKPLYIYSEAGAEANAS